MLLKLRICINRKTFCIRLANTTIFSTFAPRFNNCPVRNIIQDIAQSDSASGLEREGRNLNPQGFEPKNIGNIISGYSAVR